MRTARALWGSTHPGPSLVVTVLSLALGIAAGLEPWRLIVLVVAVFAGQVSVGLSNDAIDLFRDATVGRSDKPLVRGDTRVRTAWIAAGIALGVAVLLSAVLGWGMLFAHVIALVSAWSYNAGLKATPASLLPFLVSFGIFPSLATLSAPAPQPAALWAAFAGAMLGAGVHLTNVLPDLDDDRRTGVRGLPHRIGPAASVMLAVVGIVVAAIAVLIGSLVEGASPLAMIAFALLVTGIAAAVMIRMRRRGPDRTGFRLVMLAALVLALQLVVASGAA
ncbi:UbiA family prenyltransferase [Microbacterium sp. 77mftsu3.1]|uniref:UbiA family prenyltransferase n=1 Tax=Microbacterium sp. 77mftsu3.1 TaxID=1761802 RepID=UPI00037006C4|nr:UbiA family prenyltransferase [Microbacterium sp. 77mftsu3.1]SDG63709.1 1,4-dihydroxy-2-naphthoate octaprenyltransferase [Microbacterium sp. 77mftsu3.1]